MSVDIPPIECYLGLGSNLANNLSSTTPIDNIKLVCRKIADAFAIELIDTSPLYRSSAMALDGTEVQPDYVNAVIKCMVTCSPLELLRVLKSIEKKMGRNTDAARWTARVIDIDILWMDGIILDTQELKIPHPGLTLRPFVLYPLRDIAPELQLLDTTDGSNSKYISVEEYAHKVKDQWNTSII
ncbi:MAG: 2-amino-4-hydroxy-6-hydroxymethyldihydropteridine diphosphokinase [Gammaproteobacteria bacterium]|nr:2-amino-4-hydroxy-6-hydroxymethyldihydropteridine diphosphokinase [Gammaproteobacteria bacterium]